MPVALEGAGKVEHWARAGDIGRGGATGASLVHILSPFDPLIIQRKRSNLIFDYDHRFEAYVPKEKRQFGYFALPVLVGEEIVAALDIEDRPSEPKASDAEVELGWRGKGGQRR